MEFFEKALRGDCPQRLSARSERLPAIACGTIILASVLWTRTGLAEAAGSGIPATIRAAARRIGLLMRAGAVKAAKNNGVAHNGYMSSTVGRRFSEAIQGTKERRALILNLGCGTRTSPYCLNVDWSVYLRLKRSSIGFRLARLWLKGDRLDRFHTLDDQIVVHDLRRGIPADDASAAAVYHSHLLEHLDREAVPGFLSEVRRVLAPGGVHRIVVPDFERLCRRYLEGLDRAESSGGRTEEHERNVAAILDQMVRREAHGTSRQPRVPRAVENLLLGDAACRGETHRWMYDRVNLATALRSAGFRSVTVVDQATSAIPMWDRIDLDRDADGDEHINGSLYVEALN